MRHAEYEGVTIVDATRQRAARRDRLTFWGLTVTALLLGLAAIALSIWAYRFLPSYLIQEVLP